MTNAEIADTIIQQMGGGKRLGTMIGAHNFVAIERGLQFGFRLCRKANKITITLEPSDTYTVKFWKITTARARAVKTYQDVYADNLIPLFEKFTGLYLTM